MNEEKLFCAVGRSGGTCRGTDRRAGTGKRGRTNGIAVNRGCCGRGPGRRRAAYAYPAGGCRDLLEGPLSEMPEEARDAYRLYTDFDVEEMYLIDSALTEIGDQVFVMNSYYEETEKSAVILLNTVVDGISYSVSGYTVGELPEDVDLEILIALAAALEVND